MISVSNPAIMKPIDFIPLESGGPALILPFSEYGDLFKIVSRFPLTEKEAKSVFFRVTCAIRDLHAASIWHRDIKLENILVFSENFEDKDSVKLADFGFARRFEKGGECQDEWVGSVRYAAPELFKHISYTEKADIWSLGITLFAALTQTFPYDIETQAKDVLSGLPFLFCRPEMQRLSFPLKNLMRKMLELDPEKRLSAEQVLNHPWFDSVRPTCESENGNTISSRVIQCMQS
jgi:serine/threonine protein kinase